MLSDLFHNYWSYPITVLDPILFHGHESQVAILALFLTLNLNGIISITICMLLTKLHNV